MKRFELTTNTQIKYGRTLFQIRAAISFGSVKKGDLGGWVEKEENLIGEDAWLYEDAIALGNAVIRGGVIRGGVIRGGVIRGGVIRGGEIWGGEIWGGEIRGGEIRGGVIRGGVIKTADDYLAICSIGSDRAVLTAYRLKDGSLELTRGCFRGTLKDFEAAVKRRHGASKIGKEYLLAIKLIKLRLVITKKKVEKSKKPQ